MKLLLVVAAVLGFILFSQFAHADRVDKYVRDEMEKRQIPGVALAIIRNGQATKTAAYGFANLELKSPAKPETVFEIGSVTKQFTAACILLLEQDGKLSVDDKISQHFPEIPTAWTNITLRHLLNHTSGIKSYTGLDGFELTKHLSQEQFIKALWELPLEFAPGEQWKYCNSGYSLLGYIVENVSGKNYWDFLGKRIFGPLGMAASTNRQPGIIIPNRADGYEKKKNGEIINRDYDLTDVFAAGAIVSTAGDLAKWNAALDSNKLLNAQIKSQMWTSGKLNSGKAHGYGFGWRVEPYQDHKNIGHSGSTSGFSASLQRFPDDKLCVILLCNSGEENVATFLAKTIATFYFQEESALRNKAHR
ncbi:MAG: serine hydrolase domain-containing protein [Verrucomicrobiota bacterium]